MSTHLIETLTEFSQSEKLHFIEEEWFDMMEVIQSKYELRSLPQIPATLLLATKDTAGVELLPLKEVGTTFIQAFNGVAQPVYQLRAFSMQ
jgi:hypothetical protein